jgi:hypothetical protein
MLEQIHRKISLTPKDIPRALLREAFRLGQTDALRWLGAHGLVAAADLDSEWPAILASCVDTARWAYALGSRPAEWTQQMLCYLFEDEDGGIFRHPRTTAALIDLVADDPGFATLAQQNDFQLFASLLLHETSVSPPFPFDAVHAAARHFNIAPSLVRYAIKPLQTQKLLFICASGLVSREMLLADHGALLRAVLCAVRSNKRVRAAVVHGFALSRSDFASVGLLAPGIKGL